MQVLRLRTFVEKVRKNIVMTHEYAAPVFHLRTFIYHQLIGCLLLLYDYDEVNLSFQLFQVTTRNGHYFSPLSSILTMAFRMATKHYCYIFLLVALLIFTQLRCSPPCPSQTEATKKSDVGKEASQILDPASDLADLADLNGREGADKVCSLLKTNRHFSLNSFWSQEHDKIRDSLLHSPANEPFGKRSEELQKLIDKVLEALPPSRLRRSLRPQSVSPEHHPEKVRRILNIIWERYNAVDKASNKSSNETQPHPQEPPKLKILVFGGSPTAGSNCERNNKLKKQGGCAWPGHLEKFLNAYLGFEAVEIVNFAMGASSSAVASMMLRFRLFPSSMLPDGPDIIINAYSVNDFSYQASGSFRKMVEDFVESANTLQSCDGDRPLVVYLDDLVANYARPHSLMVGESYNAEIAKLMQWYQVMTVAYSDIVRDMVYADREESKLLVDWRGDIKHLTWAGHIAVVLSFMFNGVSTVIDFCDDEIYRSQHGNSIKATNANSANASVAVLDPSLRPILDDKITLHSITDAWVERQKSWDCKAQQQQTCAFAWVAMRREKEMGHVRGVSEIIQEARGWKSLTKWPPTNYGLYGTETNGTIILNVTDTSRRVNSVNVFYMKSYSEKWQGSKVQANIFLGSHNATESTPVASFELSGFHEKKTSEFFMEQVRFENPGSHDDVLLHLRMVGGETFRIGGLAFCEQA
jgi:hypothetical protein